MSATEDIADGIAYSDQIAFFRVALYAAYCSREYPRVKSQQGFFFMRFQKNSLHITRKIKIRFHVGVEFAAVGQQKRVL